MIVALVIIFCGCLMNVKHIVCYILLILKVRKWHKRNEHHVGPNSDPVRGSAFETAEN